MSTPNRPTDRTALAMLLSVLGGMMDGYSYAVRGGVFATAQTGNLILFGFGLARGDLVRAVRSFVPILSFWCGIFAAQHLLYRFLRKDSQQRQNRHWKSIILLVEGGVLLVIGLIPASVLDNIPNALISFLAAMQFCCFREFGDSSAYASVFVTGNMRSCAEMYYRGLVQKDHAALRKALQYTGIILSFLCGAILSLLLSQPAGEKTIWPAAAIALGCGIYLARRPKEP